MTMYAVGIVPLIHRLADTGSQQIWFADDSAAGAQLEKVKLWWDQLNATGPAYGSFPNGAKTWLVVKPHVEAKAQ